MKRWPDENECTAYNPKTKVWRIAGTPDEDGKLCSKSQCNHHLECKSYRDWFLNKGNK